MSKAFILVERLEKLLSLREEDDENGEMITFVFKGRGAGDYAGHTPSTKNTEDQLRAKGFVNGQDYEWSGPYVLNIHQSCLDRDLLDVIQSEGGQQDN